MGYFINIYSESAIPIQHQFSAITGIKGNTKNSLKYLDIHSTFLRSATSHFNNIFEPEEDGNDDLCGEESTLDFLVSESEMSKLNQAVLSNLVNMNISKL